MSIVREISEYISGPSSTADATAEAILRDYVVIPRDELPKVTVHGQGRITADGLGGEVSGVETASRNALAWLALTEHLKAHPPIDQAQVNALTAEIEQAIHDSGVGADEVHPGEIAHRLIATGRITITPDGGAS